jgi:hypothetical protein
VTYFHLKGRSHGLFQPAVVPFQTGPSYFPQRNKLNEIIDSEI